MVIMTICLLMIKQKKMLPNISNNYNNYFSLKFKLVYVVVQ